MSKKPTKKAPKKLSPAKAKEKADTKAAPRKKTTKLPAPAKRTTAAAPPPAAKAKSKSLGTSQTEYLPAGFEKALARMKAPKVSDAILIKRLAEEGGKLDKKWGPFLKSDENVRRYGFALPKGLVDLLALADRYLIEDLSEKMPSFRYLRVAPGGWEMPEAAKGATLIDTVVTRFDWNTFSNMQLWEHFAGTMSLGWDPGDNRYMVATTYDAAPVFWMDHETAEMAGCVASSLENFLRVQTGDDERVPKNERALSRQPSHWERDNDKLAYLGLPEGVPLTAWPPFLSARADWLVAMMAFGGPESMLEKPEVGCFDLARELPFLAAREPLALYWTLRAHFLDERDVFDQVAPRAKEASPLAASLVEMLDARWKAPSAKRALLKKRKDAPRTAKWPKGLSRDRLV